MESIICVYCKGSGFSREHNPPEALGGNCTIPWLCTPCNRTLSPIDQALAENSPVALSRVVLTPATAFTTYVGGRASMFDSSGYDVGVRVGNEMKAYVQPQLFLDGNRLRAMAVDREDIARLIAYVDKHIQAGTLGDTHVEVDANRAVPRFLMHRSSDSYVSASSAEQARRMLDLIQAQWADIRKALQTTDEVKTEIQRPSVVMKLMFRPNDEFRGVAKIAFETAALLCGPEFVLGDSFDPVREYIKGDVRLPAIDPANPTALLIDQRFVRRWEACPLNFTDQHGVLLMATPAGIFGLVILYGAHFYRVALAPPQRGQNWMRCYEFSYKKDGHSEVSMLEFAGRALERFPELLNIKKEDVPRYLELTGLGEVSARADRRRVSP